MMNVANDNVEMDLDENDYDYYESDEDPHWIVFDEDVLRRLKSNDPAISALEITVDDGRFNGLEIDWEVEGGAFAENTHLTSLCIYQTTFQQEVAAENEANSKLFCNALSKNRSIKELYIEGYPIDVGDMMKILSPIFEHNNLRSLVIYNFDLSERSARLLASNLLECPTSLRKLVFRINGEGDDGWQAKIVAALEIHHNLRVLELCFNQYNI